MLICECGSQKKEERDECELAGVEFKRNPAYVAREKTVDFQLRQWFSNPGPRNLPLYTFCMSFLSDTFSSVHGTLS